MSLCRQLDIACHACYHCPASPVLTLRAPWPACCFFVCGGVLQGVNTEKYVPNPTASSPQALAMFEFVGRLMGIVLRHKFYLPFELPAMVR